MNPRPTILHQAMSEAPAAIPPAHMASTICGETWRPAGIAGTVEDGTVGLMDGSWPSVAVVIPVLDEAESVGDAVRGARPGVPGLRRGGSRRRWVERWHGPDPPASRRGKSQGSSHPQPGGECAGRAECRHPRPRAATSSSAAMATRSSPRVHHHRRRDAARDRRRKRRRDTGSNREGLPATSHRSRHVDPDGWVGDARFHYGGNPGPRRHRLPGHLPPSGSRQGRSVRRIAHPQPGLRVELAVAGGGRGGVV